MSTSKNYNIYARWKFLSARTARASLVIVGRFESERHSPSSLVRMLRGMSDIVEIVILIDLKNKL
jgi:hypothetical protein